MKDTMSKATLMLGTIIQNKLWAIEPYLDAILAQDYPADRVSLVFYVNDSTDGTAEVLLERLKKVKEEGKYRKVSIIQQNYGYQDVRRERIKMQQTSRELNPDKTTMYFAHFARVRNKWLELREDEDFYMSVDSDVILTNNTIISRLVDHGLDIVAAPVDNAQNRNDGYDPSKEVWDKLMRDKNPSNRDFFTSVYKGTLKGGRLGTEKVWNYGRIRGGDLIRFKREPGLMDVDVSGACILFSKKVVEAGVKFGPNPMGEDVYFCTLARSLGFKIFVDGTIADIEHYMDYNPHEKEAIV